MAKSEFKGFDDVDTWFEGHVRMKPNQAIFKLYQPDGTFVQSIAIPSLYYPLDGQYEVFDCTNTHYLEDDEDFEIIANIINKVKYRVGHCYYNAEDVTNALKKAGYKAEMYVGWFFTSALHPVHHAWTVLWANDRPGILDLSENLYQMVKVSNGDVFKPKGTQDETRANVAQIAKKVSTMSNSEKCHPVGVPFPYCVYVGCPSTKEAGIKTYQNIFLSHPDHPTCHAAGYSETQKMFLETK